MGQRKIFIYKQRKVELSLCATYALDNNVFMLLYDDEAHARTSTLHDSTKC